MGRHSSGKKDVLQVTFILNLLLIPFGILIVITGIATENNLQPYDDFLIGNYYYLSLALISIGVLSVAIALFGCYGVLRDRFCIIMIYSHLLVAILVFKIIIAGLAFAQKGNDGEILTSKLIDNIQNYTFYTEKIDVLQSDLQCCGFNSSEEYRDLDMPSSCCGDYNCSMTAYRHAKGCGKALQEYTGKQANIISGVAIVFACLEILGFVSLLGSCRRMIKENSRSPSTQSLILEESSDEDTTHYP